MARDFSGKLLVALTWTLIVFANYTTVYQIFGRWFRKPPSAAPPLNRATGTSYFFPIRSSYTPVGTFLFAVYQLLNVFAILCHIRAVFGDPGTTISLVPDKAPDTFVCPQICKPCNFRWKPPRAHHCRKCGMCIFRMDHHCAWIDNCVGIMNQKFFVLFLVYTAVLCSYQLILLFIAFLFWISRHPLTFVMSSALSWICVLVESVAFLYMTTLDSFETNSTLVESHQRTHGLQKNFWVHVAEVFGDTPSLWLLPVQPRLHLDFTEPVFLDKAVADQLIIKQRRRKEIALLQKHRLGTTSNASETTSTFTAYPQKAELRYRKLTALSSLSHMNVFPYETARDSPVSMTAEKNEVHYPRRASETMLEAVKDRQANATWKPLPAGVSCRTRTLNELLNLKKPDDVMDDRNFKNVYLKPEADIGVELDDESRCICLQDLEEEEEDVPQDSPLDAQADTSTAWGSPNRVFYNPLPADLPSHQPEGQDQDPTATTDENVLLLSCLSTGALHPDSLKSSAGYDQSPSGLHKRSSSSVEQPRGPSIGERLCSRVDSVLPTPSRDPLTLTTLDPGPPP